MNNKTVKEFLDMTDFSDIDEVDIFKIHDGINYEYDVVENRIREIGIETIKEDSVKFLEDKDN